MITQIYTCTYLKLKTVNTLVTTVHYSLVHCWSSNGPDCSIDEPKALPQWCSFGMHCSSKGFCIQPHKVQISQEMTKSVIHVINYLNKKYVQVQM